MVAKRYNQSWTKPVIILPDNTESGCNRASINSPSVFPRRSEPIESDTVILAPIPIKIIEMTVAVSRILVPSWGMTIKGRNHDRNISPKNNPPSGTEITGRQAPVILA